MNQTKGYCSNCERYQPMVGVEEYAPIPTVWACPSVYYAGKCEVCGHTAVLCAYELKYSPDCMGKFLVFKFDDYVDFRWPLLPWYRRLAYFIARCLLPIAIGRR